MSRRSLLKCLAGTLTLGLGGCSSNDQADTPGTLVFRNEDNLPHLLTASVVSGPSTSPAVQKSRTAKSSVEPETRKRYSDFINHPGIHEIATSIDDGESTVFEYDVNGVGEAENGGAIHVVAEQGGDLSWSVNY